MARRDGDVVDDLVRLAGPAGEEARVAGRDLDVGAGLRDEDADLVERAMQREGHEGADEGDAAHLGHAGGHAEHVLLGDAHLEVALGEGILEDLAARGAAQVAVEHDDAPVARGQLGHDLAEDVAQGAAHGQAHGRASSRLAELGHGDGELLLGRARPCARRSRPP